jgi:hypothetical protein
VVTDGRARGRTGQLSYQVDRIICLVPGGDGERIRFGVNSRRLEARHHERGVAVAREHEHRESLGLERLVAGEPGQVGADRQQQHIDAEVGELASSPVHPLGRHVTSLKPPPAVSPLG